MKNLKVKNTIWIILGLASTALANPEGSAPSMTHRMMMLVLQLGLILFAARIGNILFEKLKLPGVLGELTAGIIIGPYLLGRLALPGFPQGFFPVYSSDFAISPELYGICNVAAIVLLFIVGLETDFKLFLRYSLAGGMVGLGGVIFSFIFGDLTAIFFSHLLFDKPLTFISPAAILLGVISTATSVGITARILTEQKKLDSPEGVTILAGAVIDDVLGIVCLAIGMGVITATRGGGQVEWGAIGLIIVKATLILGVAVSIGMAASTKISTLLKWFHDRTSIAIMAFGFALLVAGLFEEAGLAMIIGAYLMGLSLSKTDISRGIIERLNPIYALVVPIFFVVMGMMVNLQLLFSWKILAFGLIYTLMAILAKVLGCGLPSLFNRFNLLGAMRIGFGMLPRGEVALIVTSIGLANGFLTQKVFGVSVMMILITTLVAPPIIISLFKIPKVGQTKVMAYGGKRQITFHFPSFQIANILLSKLLEIFNSEGFFVYTLSPIDQLYQIRKNEIAIGLNLQDTDIIFDCDEKDVPLINTAMLEVLAEFERTLKELRKPVDTNAIAQQMQVATKEFEPHLNLTSFISPDLLIPHLKANDKYAAIEELLALLYKHGLVKDYEAAKKVVFDREKLMSTGIQFGIAIPHGKTEAVDNLVCAIGLKPEGLDFKSLDGAPTRIIVLSLAPREATTPHLQFLSAVGQILNDSGREQLLQCRTAKQMYRVLKETGLNGSAAEK